MYMYIYDVYIYTSGWKESFHDFCYIDFKCSIFN